MNKILEYQKLDMELNKLKKSGMNTEEKNNMTKLKGYIVEVHDKGMNLENNAGKLFNDYLQLKKQYDSNIAKVQDLLKTDISSVEMDDIDTLLSSINSLSSELFLLERNLNIIINKIKTSLNEFKETKNNITKAKQKYNEVKAKVEKGMSDIAPKVAEIEAKMSSLEKEIDEDLMSKYKTLKSDKIFPVFVGFNDGHCSGCRVEIPTSKVNKLKTDGTIVCEQCHRIIYNK